VIKFKTSGPLEPDAIDTTGKLTKNKKIREAHREHAKKVLVAVDEALSKFDASVVAKDKVTRIIITLNDKLATLKSPDESILAAAEEPNIVTEVEESEEFHAEIHAALVNYNDAKPAKTNQTIRSRVIQVFQLNVLTRSYRNCKSRSLLAIRKNGSPFGSTVHTNKALKNVDKLNYLKSLLEGAALSAITGLALTEPNYANAVDILKERFGNKQLIISSHMDALLKLKPALSDIKGIRAGCA